VQTQGLQHKAFQYHWEIINKDCIQPSQTPLACTPIYLVHTQKCTYMYMHEQISNTVTQCHISKA